MLWEINLVILAAWYSSVSVSCLYKFECHWQQGDGTQVCPNSLKNEDGHIWPIALKFILNPHCSQQAMGENGGYVENTDEPDLKTVHFFC